MAGPQQMTSHSTSPVTNHAVRRPGQCRLPAGTRRRYQASAATAAITASGWTLHRPATTPALNCAAITTPPVSASPLSGTMTGMRVYLGSDHAGFELKAALGRALTEAGHEVIDCGPAVYSRRR